MSETFNPKLDGERLGKQLDVVRLWMLKVSANGKWLTLSEIAYLLQHPEASISARLRDLRRMGYTVDKRRRGEAKRGIWEYRCTKPTPREAQPSLFEVHA
jgi:hypothetical protein